MINELHGFGAWFPVWSSRATEWHDRDGCLGFEPDRQTEIGNVIGVRCIYLVC